MFGLASPYLPSRPFQSLLSMQTEFILKQTAIMRTPIKRGEHHFAEKMML